MRILKISQAYYPFLDAGGPAVKVRAIAERLTRRNHAVTVLTVNHGFEKAPAQAEWRKQHRNGHFGWQAQLGGVEVIYLDTLARYRRLTLNTGWVSFRRERLPDFDVVHIYGLYDLLGPAVASFCRRRGLPYVVEPMGMFRPIVRNLWLKRFYHALLGGAMLRGSSRLIATSEQERWELVEGGVPEARVVVRRNGIELPEHLPPAGSFRRQWNIPAEARMILFLGRLVTKKSPELMLEAFARWRRGTGEPQSAFLVVAGPDEGDGYRQRLEALATGLGLNTGVLFTGPLYDEAKWAAYRDADLFVLPSQNENFGNTAAEAVACGTPVLVTDRCGIAPLVDQRAGLVVPHDREALRAGLARLLEDEALRQRLRAGCGEVARALGWDEPLAVMEELYAELVAEGQR